MNFFGQTDCISVSLKNKKEKTMFKNCLIDIPGFVLYNGSHHKIFLASGGLAGQKKVLLILLYTG